MTIRPCRTGIALILGFWIALGSTLPLAEAGPATPPPTQEETPPPIKTKAQCQQSCEKETMRNCAGDTCPRTSIYGKWEHGYCECQCTQKCVPFGGLKKLR